MEPLANLGLWGDGDEIWAIEEAFRRVNVEVPGQDAHLWHTVGDLWKSALNIRPSLAQDSVAWDLFRQGLSEETSADWTRVVPDTELLDGRGFTVFRRMITTVREWMTTNHA